MSSQPNYAAPAGPSYDYHQAAWVRALTAGAIDGEIAGLVMAMLMMVVFAMLGHSPLFPVQVIGSFLTGDRALHGFDAASVLTGLLLHFLGPSLFWGCAFGLVVHALKVPAGYSMLAAGAVCGALSQIVDVSIILPGAFARLQGHNIWEENVPMQWSWAAHLIYGLMLGFFARIEHALNHTA